MWNFLTQLLTQGGVIAVLVCAVIAGLGAAVWVVWKQNATFQKALLESQEQAQKKLIEEHTKALRDMEEVVTKSLDLLEQLHEAHLGSNARDAAGKLKWWNDVELAVQARKFEELHLKYNERIESIQERRIQDQQSLAREAIDAMNSVRTALEKFSAVLESFTSALRNQG